MTRKYTLSPEGLAKRRAANRRLNADPDFRIAYRIEGDYWNAYLANPADMEGATLLASISLALVPVGSSEKAKFREIVEAGLSRSLGGIEFDDPKPAPLSERAGHA